MGERRLMLRSDKVDFIKVPGADGGGGIFRMKGFTELSLTRSANTSERQYVDEAAPVTDVISVTTGKTYDFERYVNDPVHDYLAGIIDGEKVGSDAVVEIYTVDFFAPVGGRTDVYPCVRRAFAIEPSDEGSGLDAYNYSGVFQANGQRTPGYATAAAGVSPEGITEITFSETLPAA